MLPEAFLDEVKSRIPLSSVVHRLMKLTRHGREWSGLCPFHNEKSPSFTVNDDKEFFHCFGCGAHGDVVEFIMRSERMPFIDAVRKLAQEAGLEMPAADPESQEREKHSASLFDVVESACAWFQQQLSAPAGTAAREYLLGRAVSVDSVDRFRIGYAPKGPVNLVKEIGVSAELLIEAGLLRRREDGSLREMFRDRVIFPITDRRGRPVAFGGRSLGDDKPKYLNSPSSAIFDKGSTLYGLAQSRAAAAQGGRLVVVEGYLDVIACHQAGFPYAVAPLGTAMTVNHLEELWRMVPAPIVCLDADEAGRRAARTVAERALGLLKKDRFLWFAVLDEAKDPDELLRDGKHDVLAAALANPTSLADVVWSSLKMQYPPDGPESLAMFERALFAAASEIPDQFSRNRILGQFRSRLRHGWDEEPEIFRGRSKTRLAPQCGSDDLQDYWEMAKRMADLHSLPEWLKKKSIDLQGLEQHVGGVGLVRASLIKGRPRSGHAWPDTPLACLWEPGQTSMILLPEWEGEPGGRLLDLVAWDPRKQTLATLCGRARVLNEAAVLAALGFEARGLVQALRVAETPLSWLRMRADNVDAVLVTDWTAVWPVLGGLSRLQAETVDLGESLDRYVRPPRLRRPEILVEADA